MPTLEAGLWKALTSAPRVAGLVGDRIFPEVIPQDAQLPAMAYQRVSGPRSTFHGGPTGWAQGRIQLTITAETYAAAKDVAEAVRDLFPFHGELGGLVTVAVARLENEVDGYGPQIEAPTVRLDLWFLYSE